MDKDEIIRQLMRENELLKGRIMELVAKLAMHDNAHTPPSLKRGGKRKKDQNAGEGKKPGQKKGHKGVTRPLAKPNRQVEVMKDRCPDCGTELGAPFSVESKRFLNHSLLSSLNTKKVEKLIGKIENGFLVLVHICHSSRVLSQPITERKGHKSLGM